MRVGSRETRQESAGHETTQRCGTCTYEAVVEGVGVLDGLGGVHTMTRTLETNSKASTTTMGIDASNNNTFSSEKIH